MLSDIYVMCDMFSDIFYNMLSNTVLRHTLKCVTHLEIKFVIQFALYDFDV